MTYKAQWSLILSSVLILFICCQPNSDQEPSPEVTKVSSDSCQIIDINADGAYEYFLTKTAIFIDARDNRFYRIERIKNSQSYPYFTRMKWIGEFQTKYDNSTFIIVYCDDTVCGLSGALGEELIKFGYCNIFNLVGGITEWKNLGHPVQSSH